MEGSLDQADLLSVATGEVADTPIEVGLEALGQRLGSTDVAEPPQLSKEADDLAAGHPRVVGVVAGQVAQARADSDALGLGVETEDGCRVPR